MSVTTFERHIVTRHPKSTSGRRRRSVTRLSSSAAPRLRELHGQRIRVTVARESFVSIVGATRDRCLGVGRSIRSIVERIADGRDVFAVKSVAVRAYTYCAVIRSVSKHDLFAVANVNVSRCARTPGARCVRTHVDSDADFEKTRVPSRTTVSNRVHEPPLPPTGVRLDPSRATDDGGGRSGVGGGRNEFRLGNFRRSSPADHRQLVDLVKLFR